MTNTDIERFGLKDLDVAALGTSKATDVLERLSDADFEGMLACAPHEVSVLGPQSLPLAAFVATPTNRPILLRRYGIVAATRVESGETFFGRCEEWKEPASDVEPVFDPADKVGRSVEQLMIDAGEAAPQLPWRAGTVVARIVVLGQRSNDVRVKLSAGVDTAPPEVSEAIEKMRAVGPRRVASPGPLPGRPVPSYRKEGATPAAPSTVGLSVVLPRVIATRAESLVVRGSFTLPVPRRALAPKDAPQSSIASDEWRSVACFVPVALLFTGRAALAPLVVRLDVPAFEVLDDGSETPRVRGYFNVDLLRLRETPRLPDDWSVWAFAGEEVAGPLPLTVVSESMAPGPSDR